MQEYFHVIVTKHAKERMEERCGAKNPIVRELLKSHSNCEKIAKVAFREGLTPGDCNPEVQKRASLLFQKPKGAILKIFGEDAYFFSKNILITVVSLPDLYNDSIGKLLRSESIQA